jgi:type IV pilus assembly protein PilF
VTVSGRAWWIAILATALFGGCASNAERETERQKRRTNIDTQLQLAVGYLQRNKPELAKSYIERALEIDGDDSQANNFMAYLQWQTLKQPDEAERYFRRAIESDPANSAAFHNYGAFLCDRQRVDEGIVMLEKATANAIYPAAADANVNAGVCVLNKPAPRVAEKYFREALRLNPRQGRALYFMAKLSFDAGNALPARGFMQRYFQSAADTPEALLLAMRIELALKDKESATGYAVRLKKKFPDSPEAATLSAAPRAKATKGKK